jgi:hypothetical protein
MAWRLKPGNEGSTLPRYKRRESTEKPSLDNLAGLIDSDNYEAWHKKTFKFY